MTDHTSKRILQRLPFPDECAFCEENLEGHALGALDHADRARIERHLQWCGPCRRALADVRAITDVLPLAVDQVTPSPEARTSLFRRLEAETNNERRAVSFGDPWASAWSTASNGKGPSTGQANRVTGAPSWLAPALIGPLAIALLVMGAWANSLRHDLEQAQAGIQSGDRGAAAASSAPGPIQLYAMEPSCTNCGETAASGQLGGDPNDNVGVLMAWNLKPNERHQIWCEDRDGRQLLVSDFDVAPDGDVVQAVQFPDAIGGYTTIYVTRHDGTEQMRLALSDQTIEPTPSE